MRASSISFSELARRAGSYSALTYPVTRIINRAR